MDISSLIKVSDYCFMIEQRGEMRVPAFLYGDEKLLKEMDEKVFEQLVNVASLPGIVKAAYAMPDAHWGYGFPIGGVAAFDVDDGVISAGGVGFDISCGVRTMTTGIQKSDFLPYKELIAHELSRAIPAGVGSRGRIKLSFKQMDKMLLGGASWAVSNGYGEERDLERTEHNGKMEDADPGAVSERAKERQSSEMGTLGSGNHYLEIQEIEEIYDERAASLFGLEKGEIVVSIHCGSRGLGHQIASEYSKRMISTLAVRDRELASAPISSQIGQEYLGAMRAAINCALANREILSHLTRQAFGSIIKDARLSLLYDVSHNTCLEEQHNIDGKTRVLFVHRKGATRALPPHHKDLCPAFKEVGQPVLIGGTMGTASYILRGTADNEAFASTCHGAGRQMSRTQATKRWRGQEVVTELEREGITVCCRSKRGVAEEAPGAYKDVNAVVDATESAHLSKKVARLTPIVCVKG